MENIVKDSFVVLSDFHSRWEPLNKIEDYYLDEYDKIYILGDATERGPKENGAGGVDLLYKIKDLSEKTHGRVQYIPGNHDQFVFCYGYALLHQNDIRMRHNISSYEKNLIYNGGAETIETLKYLKNCKPEELNELVNWLGSQRVQQVHTYNGQKYALAHAFFDMNVYRENKNLDLRELCERSGKLAHIVWYRKGYNKDEDNSLIDAVPSGDYIEVIGHTPNGRKRNLDLINKYGEHVKVMCVDGGLTYGGDILKYDGGSKIHRTKILVHNDTSPSVPVVEAEPPIDTMPEEISPMMDQVQSAKEFSYRQLTDFIDGYVSIKLNEPLQLKTRSQAFIDGCIYYINYVNGNNADLPNGSLLTEFIEGYLAREWSKPSDLRGKSPIYLDGFRYIDKMSLAEQAEVANGLESINRPLAEFVGGYITSMATEKNFQELKSERVSFEKGYQYYPESFYRSYAGKDAPKEITTPLTGFIVGYIATMLQSQGELGDKQFEDDEPTFMDGSRYYNKQRAYYDNNIELKDIAKDIAGGVLDVVKIKVYVRKNNSNGDKNN